MPQIDICTFSNQNIWILISFYFFFIVLSMYIVPHIYSNLYILNHFNSFLKNSKNKNNNKKTFQKEFFIG